MEKSKEVKDAIDWAWFVMAAFALAAVIQLMGCSFKIETLYHGQTPVGISDTKSTTLRAMPIRTVKMRQEAED